MPAGRRLAGRENLGPSEEARLEPYAGDVLHRLLQALDSFDEAGAELVLDEVLDRLPLDDALSRVIMPFLVEVGDSWEAGVLSVIEEHFASHIVRSRLAALAARTASAEHQRTAVVACPPGERHDIAPLAFSLLLRREGWQVRYLGADTPVTDLAHVCVRIRPDLVVVAATRTTALLGAARELRRVALPGRHRWCRCLPGARPRPRCAMAGRRRHQRRTDRRGGAARRTGPLTAVRWSLSSPPTRGRLGCSGRPPSARR